MSNIHDEEKLGKAYDSKLMKRLLSYAKPYKWLLILSIVLLMLITAADLTGPYLIKVAIDDHINALDHPMVAFDEKSAPDEPSVKWYVEGKSLIRNDHLDNIPTDPSSHYQINEINNSHYLINGHFSDEEAASLRLQDSSDVTSVVTSDGTTYSANRLTDEGVKDFRQQDVAALTRIASIFLVILTVGFVLNYTQTYTLHFSGQRIIYSIRQQIFSHLQRLPLKFFDKNPVGRLVTRTTNDTEALNEMYTNVLVNLFKDVFILVGIMGIMLSLNVKLALLAFLTLPLIIFASWIYKKVARNAFREVRTRLARINAFLSENISGMRIVHVFKREKQQFELFDEINKSHFKAGMKELQASAIFRPLMDLIYALGLATLIWFGGRDVIGGALEFGVLYAFIDYINRFFQPINDMTEKYTIMQSAMASSERIFMLLDEEDTIPNPTEPTPVTRFKGEIEFKNVWFAYNDEDWVLRDVSFKISPGNMVAFVGATGAGKSSIINLLSRFYDIQKGSITIDGVDIREYDKDELRRNIGVVLQDVFLFTGDIKSNIRLNNIEITDERIKEVARYVNAETFINRLPNGYDEEVKERGSTLSAGQRQLLAFARTLAFNPAVLVLDEATSNIDTETELLIQDAMKKVSEGRTTIVVAHRLSTIQHADNIIVMHKGKIREAGTHQQLLEQNGLYYKLYQLQYKESLQEDNSKLDSMENSKVSI